MIRRLLKANKGWILPLLERLQIRSLRCAAREQGLESWVERLGGIVPDLADQYTQAEIDTPALRAKVRAQHAFQMRLLMDAVRRLSRGCDGERELVLADIGDSSGTHTRYLQALAAGDPALSGRKLSSFSVNLDSVAVAKIRGKGLKALLCRAEEMHEKHGVRADLFFALETLEHLRDPVGFLDALSRKGGADFLVVTVPYLAQSRVGLHHLRQGRREANPESTHFFELSPKDWKLLFRQAGWEPVQEEIYRQYPLRGSWRLMRSYWKRFDFEGFYGVVLKKDRSWAEGYRS